MEVIRNTTHDTVRAQYPMVSIVDAFARWINVRQYDDKDLVEYTKRMKQLSDVVKSMIGDSILHEYVKGLEEYKLTSDVLKKADIRDASWEQLNTFLLLRGLDQSKYGSLIKGIATQYLLMRADGKPNDQYPKTLAHAIDALSNYSFDHKYYKNKQRKRQGRHKKCNEGGNDDDKKSFAQKGNFFCYYCGAKDHASTKCPERNMRSREE